MYGRWGPRFHRPGYLHCDVRNLAKCTNGTQTDNDGDGLSTFCENNLAAAFAPQLKYDPIDNIGGEPHWVAQKIAGNKVRIAYLLSYYLDQGSSLFWCGVPFIGGLCTLHNGDSEEIVLDLYYDIDSFHWILDKAHYSRHGNWPAYERLGNPYPMALEYPGRAGGYPRSWVAKSKHANYPTQASCNGGNDTCAQNSAGKRVFVSAATNLGARNSHSSAQDTVVSANPSYQYYGSGKTEAYWTGADFRGWIPLSIGGPASSAYSGHLTYFGF